MYLYLQVLWLPLEIHLSELESKQAKHMNQNEVQASITSIDNLFR